MCIGFPGRVVGLDEAGATVETEGRRRRASTLLIPDIALDDWVFVAAGTIIERLAETEAQEIRSTLLEAAALEEAESARYAAAGTDPAAKEGAT